MNKSIVISLTTACLISSLSAANMDNIPVAKTYPADTKVTVNKTKKESKAKVGTVSTNAELTTELKKLKKDLKKAQKKIKKLDKKLNKVKAHDAFDNIKFSVDFRNSIDNINYKYNSYKPKVNGVVEDWSGTEASNDALLTSRLYLNMKSKPMDKLTFYGQMAMYGTWGGSHLSHDATLKDWSESSKATDAVFRIRQAFIVWADTLGEDGIPYNLSVGRRQSTDGFLANHRENYDKPLSPLAHVTNMEVNGVMFQLNLEKYVFPGTFIKFVYGRAHTGGIHTLNDLVGYKPYAQETDEDADINENVDFFVVLGSLYNDGQYNLMYENAMILNTKGARTGTPTAGTLPSGKKNKSLDAGTANLTAIGLELLYQI